MAKGVSVGDRVCAKIKNKYIKIKIEKLIKAKVLEARRATAELG